MRINLVFTISLFTILQVSANTFGQRININEKNVSLSTVLKTIRNQSGYDVLFDAKLIQKAPSISIYVKDATVEEALEKCLEGLSLTYKLEEHTVIIKEKSLVEKITDHLSYKMSVNEITGTVRATNGEILAGASVTVKRTKKTTLTDNKGDFFIKEVLSSDSLEVSFIGYKSRTLAVGSRNNIYILLEEAINPLDILVVQGYGKTSRRLATGNITRIGADELGNQIVDNPILALKGKVAGLDITQADGMAFSNQKIEIRGRKSINSNFGSDPLVIIDGIPQTVSKQVPNNAGTMYQTPISSGMLAGSGTSNLESFSPLYGINANDIESIEVLKDADATAIYGSRGGNGVILITTKGGRIGKTELNAKAGHGINYVINEWDLLNTDEYLAMRREIFRNDGLIPNSVSAPELFRYDQNRYTNWQDFAYGGTGRWSDFNMDLNGGDARTTFRVGAGLNTKSEIIQRGGMNSRFSTNFSLRHKALNNKLLFDLRSGFGKTKNTARKFGGNVHLTPPNAPAIFNEAGALNFAEWQTHMTPFASLLTENQMEGQSINLSGSLSYSLLKNLNILINGGYSSNSADHRFLNPLAAQNTALSANSTNRLYHSAMSVNNALIEPQLTYANGRLSAIVGGSYQNNSNLRNWVRGEKFASDEQMNSVNNAALFAAGEGKTLYKYAGVFARLTYNLYDKYVVNLNARRDGSSRFGKDYRFGNFGSVGATWILSKENFVRSILPKTMSTVKLRGSYGVTGSDGIGDYKFLQQWGSSSSGGAFRNYDGITALYPQLLNNSEFRWQRNVKSEIGLNLGFFEDNLTLDLSYYSDFTNNQLLSFPTPMYSGFSSLILNSPAEVSNKGYELSLGISIINSKKFSWSANFNLSRNTNTLVDYPDFESSPYYSTYKIGQSLGTQYVFEYLGVDPQTGNYTFKDGNGDGIITHVYNAPAGINGDDRIAMINTNPNLIGGMFHSFKYKGLYVQAAFNFKTGKAMSFMNATGNNNIARYTYQNTWHKPGDNAKYAKLSTQPDNRAATSTVAYADIDFIRLTNITLGYQVTSEIVKSLGISRLAFNLSAQNIFVLTKFPGLDPELTTEQSFPQQRVVTMGLNCTF
ncbi:SusC/RagA family TonB-linked outer membrane protein [Pedobacter sp. UBA4863]|nr:SusC/RagA family TonB-linked outer membrane protein [Pedobacter sp. UBA4863]